MKLINSRSVLSNVNAIIGARYYTVIILKLSRKDKKARAKDTRVSPPGYEVAVFLSDVVRPSKEAVPPGISVITKLCFTKREANTLQKAMVLALDDIGFDNTKTYFNSPFV